MLTSFAPAVSLARLRATTRMERLLRNIRNAQLMNPRTSSLAAGVTVTDNGSTLPAEVSSSNGYLMTGTTTVSLGIWTIDGATPSYSSGGTYRCYSAVIWTNGGTLGLNDGRNCNFWRASVMADCRYLAFKVGSTTAAYRFLVDGHYVSMTGITLGTTSGSTPQYILLDFGSRAVRQVTLEGQTTCALGGAYTEATGKLWTVDRSDSIHASFIGDSYIYGSAATVLGDGVAPVCGDWLGATMHASGSGGTGWATTGNAYRFDQRIANGDLALGGVVPDLILMMASVNDRTLPTATVTANAHTGMQTARALYPNTPIIMFGCAGASYVSSVLATEAAVQSAVNQLADPMTAFVPVSSDSNGAWVSGSGKVGTPANDGNSDWATVADGTHPSDEGCAMLGRRYARAALGALTTMYRAM